MGRTTDEIIGYFNPATGETSVYTPEETGGAAPAEGGAAPAPSGISWASEADTRAVVNEGLNSGKSADALKTALANVKLRDSAKTTYSDRRRRGQKKRRRGKHLEQDLAQITICQIDRIKNK